MGFLMKLGLFYVLLIIFSVVSFATKKKIIGITLLSVIILSFALIAVLWTTSPM